MRLGPAPEVEEAPGQFWKDFIRETAPVFRTPTIEQLAVVHRADVPRPLRRGAVRRRPSARDPRRAGAFGHRRGQRRLLPRDPRERAAVGPHRLVQPARDPGSRRSHPCSPATRRVTELAGTSSAPNISASMPRCTRSSPSSSSSAARLRCPRARSSMPRSALNLYVYPEEIDYARERPLGPDLAPARLLRPRRSRRRSSLPDRLADSEGSLVYLSLGSLGSADVELMRRLVEAALRARPHRFIVSKGPQHDELELADNMWGEEFLPQPAILPLVDLVITHGGNNTTTECLHVGQADGRAAAVLGPGRQRPAHRRDRARPPPPAVLVSRRRSCSAGSISCSPTTRSTPGCARSRARIRQRRRPDARGRPDRAGRAGRFA